MRVSIYALTLIATLAMQAQDIQALNSSGQHRELLSYVDSILRQESDPQMKVSLLNSKLDSYRILENWGAFKNSIDEAIKLRMALRQPESLSANEFTELIWYYQAIAKFDSAAQVGERAIKLAKQLGNNRILAKAYNNHAYTFTTAMGRIEGKSLPYYDSARNVLGKPKTYEDSTILARWYHNKGNYYNNFSTKTKDLRSKRINVAQHYYDSSLMIYSKYGDKSCLSLNSYVRGWLYRESDGVLASKYYKQAYDLILDDKSEPINEHLYLIILPRLANAYLSKYIHYDHIQDLLNAYQYTKIYLRMYDKLSVLFDETQRVFFSTYSENLSSSLIHYGLVLKSLGQPEYYSDAIGIALQSKNISLTHNRNPQNTSYERLTLAIQQSIPNHSAFISYFTSYSFSGAVVITKNKISVFPLDSLVNLRKNISLLYKSKSDETYIHLSKLLYKQLMEPIAMELEEEIDHLIISPDNDIHYVPFEALISEHTGRDMGSVEFLINQYTISYEFSALNLLNKPPPLSDLTSLYLSAAPETHTQLPFAQQLFDKLKSIYPNTRIENNVTKERFKELIPLYQHIHIASHAINGSDQNLIDDFITSKLNRYGDYNVSGIHFHNGKLPLAEFLEMNLKHVNLIVTQGCETSQGVFLGEEGIRSISSALYKAGAQSILGTLWEIDDKYSSKILADFYKHLEHHPKAEALRLAKLDFIRNAKTDREKHPHNWAALMYFGLDGDLKLSRERPTISPEYVFVLLLIASFMLYIRLKPLRFIKK